MLGRSDESAQTLKKVLEIRRRTLGPRHFEVGFALSDLGSAYKGLGRLAEAAEVSREAMAINIENFGADNPNVAADYNNLAGILVLEGNNDEALELYRRGIAILDAAPNADQHARRSLLLGMGRMLLRLGRVDEAADCFKALRAIIVKANGKDHSNTAQSTNWLARTLLARGELVAAEREARRAWELTQGKEDFQTPAAEAATVLGEVLFARADYAQAREFAERAVALRHKAGDPAALRADSERVLAQLMARNPAERAKALELARKARASFEPTRQDWREIAQRLEQVIASASE